MQRALPVLSLVLLTASSARAADRQVEVFEPVVWEEGQLKVAALFTDETGRSSKTPLTEVVLLDAAAGGRTLPPSTATSDLEDIAPYDSASATYTFALEQESAPSTARLRVRWESEVYVSNPFSLGRPKEESSAPIAPEMDETWSEPDPKYATDRWEERIKGELRVRFPSLFDTRTAYTLGRRGFKIEPVGFFTYGFSRAIDLGLGVKVFKSGGEKLFFPGVDLKVRLLPESRFRPAIAVSATGNTLFTDRAQPVLSGGGVRLGSGSFGFAEQAQNVGDTQYTLGVHASKRLVTFEDMPDKPVLRVHGGVVFSQTQTAKGAGAVKSPSRGGSDLFLTAGFDLTVENNILSLIGEGVYSAATERFEASAGFRFFLVGLTLDLGAGLTGPQSEVVDGSLIELPARFFPRLGAYFHF